jgi:hypothetical protein
LCNLPEAFPELSRSNLFTKNINYLDNHKL